MSCVVGRNLSLQIFSRWRTYFRACAFLSLSLSHVYFLWFISLSSIWISSKPLCLIETDCSAGSSPKQRDRRDYVERGEERTRAFVITLNWRNIMGSSSGREIMCSWWPADLYWIETIIVRTRQISKITYEFPIIRSNGQSPLVLSSFSVGAYFYVGASQARPTPVPSANDDETTFL